MEGVGGGGGDGRSPQRKWVRGGGVEEREWGNRGGGD